MSRLKFALLALILLLPFVFSQNLEAALKTDAIHSALMPVFSPDAIAAYDNFIAIDGNEYVILVIDQTPSFLMRLERANGTYSADFVRDPKDIDTILNARYSQIENQKKNITEINSKIREEILEFNTSRFLHEAKYDLLFGIDNTNCVNEEECVIACRSTKVCRYTLEKTGNSIISDMIKYQNSKNEINSLVKKVMDESSDESKSEVETLTIQLDIVQKIREEIDKMQNSEFLKQSHIIYSGQIIYDITSVDDAYEQIQLAIEPARAIDERRRSVESIKEITQLRAPAVVDEEPLEQVDLIEKTQSAPSNNQTIEVNYADAYPPIHQNLDEEKGILTVDNIVLFMSILIVSTTVVYILYLIRKYLQKDGSAKRFGTTHPRGIPPLGKKKIGSLEDLL